MGGVLSKHPLPVERPVIEVLQDETIVRQHDCQQKCWRKDGNARMICPKGDGAAVMLSGFIDEITGGFPTLTWEEVEKYNRLIQVIETSLGMLLRAISGQEVMSPALD